MNCTHCGGETSYAHPNTPCPKETEPAIEPVELEMEREVVTQHYWPWESPADVGEPAAEPITLEMEREVVTHTEVLTCTLTTAEGMRRLTRPQMRQLLHARLQAFGDLIMATWEKQYGGEEEG